MQNVGQCSNCDDEHKEMKALCVGVLKKKEINK